MADWDMGDLLWRHYASHLRYNQAASLASRTVDHGRHSPVTPREMSPKAIEIFAAEASIPAVGRKKVGNSHPNCGRYSLGERRGGIEVLVKYGMYKN